MKEMAASNDFCTMISDLSRSVRLRKGSGNSISRELRLWQAVRYQANAQVALNEWAQGIKAATTEE